MTRALTTVAAIALTASRRSAVHNLILTRMFDTQLANSRMPPPTSIGPATWPLEHRRLGRHPVTTSPTSRRQAAGYVRNLVSIKPGKRLYQVIFLPDIGVRHAIR